MGKLKIINVLVLVSVGLTSASFLFAQDPGSTGTIVTTWRRVPVALGACWSESCSREAALRIGAVLGWNENVIGANLEAFETERAAFLRPALQTAAAFEAAAD